MPIVFKKVEKDYSIGIWQSIEQFTDLLEISNLNDADYEKWNSFQSEKRKREWITVRALLSRQFAPIPPPNIWYDEFGKPRLDNGMSISISHTKEFIAILTTTKKYAGIDLESLRDHITILAPKFANEDEMRNIPEEHRIVQLHILWGAKEVLFKLHGLGQLDFRKNLHVEDFQFQGKGEISAWIRKNGSNTNYTVCYELWEGMMLAFCASE